MKSHKSKEMRSDSKGRDWEEIGKTARSHGIDENERVVQDQQWAERVPCKLSTALGLVRQRITGATG